jgi:hypothetical protein
VRDQSELQADYQKARERLDAQRSVVEQRQRIRELRIRVSREWDRLDFAELQVALRDLVDRIEVNGESVKVFQRS